MHHFEPMTPRLIISKINDDRARITPVVKSWNGVPGYGFNPSKTKNPQQLSNEKIVTRTYPEIQILFVLLNSNFIIFSEK